MGGQPSQINLSYNPVMIERIMTEDRRVGEKFLSICAIKNSLFFLPTAAIWLLPLSIAIFLPVYLNLVEAFFHLEPLTLSWPYGTVLHFYRDM